MSYGKKWNIPMIMHDWNSGSTSVDLTKKYGFKSTYECNDRISKWRKQGWDFVRRGNKREEKKVSAPEYGSSKRKQTARQFICNTIHDLTPIQDGDDKLRYLIDSLNYVVELIDSSDNEFWGEAKKIKDCSAGRIVKWL